MVLLGLYTQEMASGNRKADKLLPSGASSRFSARELRDLDRHDMWENDFIAAIASFIYTFVTDCRDFLIF